MLTNDQIEQFEGNGYLIVPGLFTADEARFYRDHYMAMRAAGNGSAETLVPDSSAPADAYDPLLKYPRLMQMHRHDRVSLDWLLEPRLNAALTGLLGREPYAVQTMHYFKPPQARGQALHQDNYYLRVSPGTCVAAWMALEDIDEANGCLQVVPGSQHWPVLCTIKADPSKSFTDVTVPIPEGTPVVPIRMRAGDVLFFNGQIVHGSLPNTTQDRFRRSLIAHYIEGDSQQVASWYKPTLRMDGTEVTLESSAGGSQCGVWVSKSGQPAIEVLGFEQVEKATE